MERKRIENSKRKKRVGFGLIYRRYTPALPIKTEYNSNIINVGGYTRTVPPGQKRGGVPYSRYSRGFCFQTARTPHFQDSHQKSSVVGKCWFCHGQHIESEYRGFKFCVYILMNENEFQKTQTDHTTGSAMAHPRKSECLYIYNESLKCFPKYK